MRSYRLKIEEENRQKADDERRRIEEQRLRVEQEKQRLEKVSFGSKNFENFGRFSKILTLFSGAAGNDGTRD